MSDQFPTSKRCKDFLRDFSRCIDQDVSPGLCEEIERHLTECADCEVMVDTLQQTISLYHALPQPDMPEHLRERLYRTLYLAEFLPGTIVPLRKNGGK